MKNRKIYFRKIELKESFLQKIKMISAVLGAFKHPAEGAFLSFFFSFGEKNVYSLGF